MKYKKIILITIIILVVLISLGITYAFYKTNIIENKADTSVDVVSEKLELTYADGTADVLKGEVNPGDVFTKNFSVTNTGDKTATYSIVIDNKINEFERNYDWTYSLKSGEEELETGIIYVGSYQILRGKEELEPQETKEYTLTITYENSSQ